MIFLLLFAQSSTPVWLQKITKKSSAIYIELLSAQQENSQKSTPPPKNKSELINKPQLENTQTINTNIQSITTIEKKPQEKSAVLTSDINTDDFIEEIINNNQEENKQEEINKQPIENLPTTEETPQIDDNNSQNFANNDFNENNNSQNELNNNQLINVDEEYENEDANEDSGDISGFETMYRTQYNEKTVNINQENINKNFTDVPVFDDILFVSESKAKQHLIKPSPPQLPLEVMNNSQQSWQVVITLYVDKNGNVLNQPKPFIKPLQSSGNPLVDENALQYVTSLHFKPFIKNNKAVVAEVELLVRY